MVETQLCKPRGTQDTLIGRACDMFHLQYDVCDLYLRYGYIYDMVVDNQFNKFHGRAFARILYVSFMRELSR